MDTGNFIKESDDKGLKYSYISRNGYAAVVGFPDLTNKITEHSARDILKLKNYLLCIRNSHLIEHPYAGREQDWAKP